MDQPLICPKAASFFDIPITRDVAHPTLPLTISEPHPLRAYVQRITDVVNEAGLILEEKGYRNLAHFILDVTASDEGPLTADRIVEAIVKTFPSMRDMERWRGKGTYSLTVVYGEWYSSSSISDVYIFRRAQLIALSLYQHFTDTDPSRFRFPDIDQLTLLADDTMPAILVHNGIIKVSSELQQRIESGEDFGKSTERWDIALRAAAIDAGEIIVQEARKAEGLDPLIKHMSPVQLDSYIRQWTREQGDIDSKRLVNTETIFF